MKKFISLLIAIIIAFSFAACSPDNAEQSQGNDAVTVDLAAVKANMIEQLSPVEPIDLQTESLLDLYGINAEDVAESACYTTMDGVFPEEVIMVKATDQDALARIEEKMNTRIDAVKVQSQNYDAENYAIAQKCEVQKNGNYIAMFLSPEYDTLTQIFNSYFNG